AGDGGERCPDHEGHGNGAVDVDAEQRGHGLVLLAGAHVAPQPRVRYQPGEQHQQHDGGDDDDDLDVGKLYDKAGGSVRPDSLMQGIAARDDRRHRLYARALGHLRKIDHADDAVDHGVAYGDQAVDRAEHEAVDQLLGEIIHALPFGPVQD